MDVKAMEMNNLRVLHDYLNQTLDALTRGQRPAPGADVVWGQGPWQGPWGMSGSPSLPQPASFGGQASFSGVGYPMGYPAYPMYSAYPMYPGVPSFDPSFAQRSFGGFGQGFGGFPQTFSWQPPSFSQGYSPSFEATRQAQVNQALTARQQVLEAMCRCAGIPV